jgi:hypothetical protein
MRAIVDRTEWGAEAARTLEPLGAVQRIVVHHTATPWDAHPDAVRRIQRLHMHERGWADIGYHLLVGPDGIVFEGRARDARGAHARGHNASSLGIAVIGDFSSVPPAPAALAALRRCIEWLTSEIDLQVSAETVVGHGEIARTACPGASLLQRLHQLRLAP